MGALGRGWFARKPVPKQGSASLCIRRFLLRRAFSGLFAPWIAWDLSSPRFALMPSPGSCPQFLSSKKPLLLLKSRLRAHLGGTPCSSGFINNWDFCWFASTREGQRAARGDSKQQHPRQGAEGQARRARVAVPGHPASPGGRKAPRATPRAEGATRASRCLDLLTAQAKLPDLLSACAETGGKVAACWGAGWSTSGAWRNP